MIVVVTFRFSNPSILALWVEILRFRLGVAETATAKAVRTTRKVRREENSIAAKAVKVAGGATPWSLHKLHPNTLLVPWVRPPGPIVDYDTGATASWLGITAMQKMSPKVDTEI